MRLWGGRAPGPNVFPGTPKAKHQSKCPPISFREVKMGMNFAVVMYVAGHTDLRAGQVTLYLIFKKDHP